MVKLNACGHIPAKDQSWAFCLTSSREFSDAYFSKGPSVGATHMLLYCEPTFVCINNTTNGEDFMLHDRRWWNRGRHEDNLTGRKTTKHCLQLPKSSSAKRSWRTANWYRRAHYSRWVGGWKYEGREIGWIMNWSLGCYTTSERGGRRGGGKADWTI